MKYILFNYHQDIYLKIHNYKQQDWSMKDNLTKFENFMIKGDLREVKEQSIACYLTGMRFDISRIIYMQPYNTLQDVIKLAFKVKALNKYRSSTITRSVAKEGFSEDSISRNSNDSKTTPKPQVKIEVQKLQQESTSKLKRCYKCQGFEHIAYEFPNRKVVAPVDEDEAKEEDVEEGVNLTMCKKMRKNLLCLTMGLP